MARKLLNDKQKLEIIAIVSVGCSRETAARYVGCSVRTIRNTIQYDDGFAREILRGCEQSEVYFLQRIQKAAAKEQYWRAAAWALERRLPNRYGPRGANTLTLEQVRTFMTKLADTIISNVSSSEERQVIIGKIHSLLASLDSQAKNTVQDQLVDESDE